MMSVAFIPPPAPTKKLAISSAPGRPLEDLEKDLERLHSEFKADMLVSLLEDRELHGLGIQDLRRPAASSGIWVVRLPIHDGGAPPLIKAHRLVELIAEEIRDGRVVVVHCMGGLGRSGTLAACVLVALGEGPEDAIAKVRAAQPNAIETKEQVRFVFLFAEFRAAAALFVSDFEGRLPKVGVTARS